MRGKVIRFDKKVIKSEQICSNMIKKELPPSKDGSSSCLLLHHPALIAGASARLWMPDSVLHTLPRTGEGRFSSHYRLSPQTHPDVLLMHPDSPIPHLHQWGTSGRYPMPFLALNGAVLPASIKMIGEPFYRPLLQGCPDVLVYPEPF